MDGNIDRMSAGEVGRRVNLNLPAGPRGHVPLRVFAEHLHKVTRRCAASCDERDIESYPLFKRLTLYSSKQAICI